MDRFGGQKFPFIYLTYLTSMLYFLIWHFHILLLLVFFFSLGLALWRKYWMIFPCLIVAGLFIFASQQKEQFESQHLEQSVHEIRPVADTIEVNGNSLSFVGQSQGHKFQAYYLLKTEDEQKYFKQLDHNVSLEIEGKLSLPEGQRNFHGFNYQSYLKTQNIYQILQIEDLKQIKKESSFDLFLLRRRAILWVENHFPKPMSSYMTGLLFGYLGKDFEEMGDLYSSLGIIHLFALSGMQVNFFIDYFRKLFLRLGLRVDYLDWLQIPFSIFYAFLTGLAISVIRALFQKNIKLRGLDNFSLTFFLLLLFFPKFLLTVGGQLSMAYAFLLTILAEKFLVQNDQPLAALKKTLLESTVLSIGVLPLLVWNFHVFQPLSILLTFVFSFIFDLFMLPILVILFTLSFIGFSININGLFLLLEEIVKFTDQIFHYPLVLGSPSLAILLALFLCSGLLIDFLKQKKKAAFLGFLIVLLFYFSKNSIYPSITMVDIGQGDSIFLQDSFNSENILIDTGGSGLMSNI